ncbi:E3 SUMO-protein ligase NSE2-like [Anneissia japonica]|uniref:E3 SUMO-protein ligase NSE2-like n=1 Tax=Anneissia japonica TaxID=1529436 RepID=UPI0014258467|nr:E3 SUMO-protein ligase NSE2-like [Anneissia japonica]
MSSQVHFAVLDSAMSQLHKTIDMIPNGMKDTVEVALDLAEYDGKTEQIKEMENTMLEMIALERNLEYFKLAVRKVSCQVPSNIGSGCTEKDLIKTLQQFINELEVEGEKTPLENHEKYQEMKKQLWQVQHPDLAFPTQAQTELGEDEEFVMTQAEVSLKCPITQREMTDPVKNKHCGHSYEKSAVNTYMKSRKKVMCPVCGCGNQNPLQKADLQDDKEIRQIIQRKNRQAGKRTALQPLETLVA